MCKREREGERGKEGGRVEKVYESVRGLGGRIREEKGGKRRKRMRKDERSVKQRRREKSMTKVNKLSHNASLQ